MEYEFRYGIDNRVIALCGMYNIKIETHMDSSSLSMSEADYAKLCNIMPKARIILVPKSIPVKTFKPRQVKSMPLKPIHGTTVEEFLAKVKASKKYWWCDSQGVPKFYSSRVKVENEYKKIRHAEGAPPEGNDIRFIELEKNYTLAWFLPEWQNSHPELCQNKDWYITNKNIIEYQYEYWRESKYQEYLYDEKKRDDEFTVVFHAIIGVPIIGFAGYLLWPLIKMIFGYIGFLLSLPFVFLFSMDSAGPQEFAMGFFFSFALFIAIVAFLLNLFR